MPLPASFREDNFIGNVLTTIRDREPTDAETGREVQTIEEIVERFAERWGEGDFDAAESAFWDAHGGRVCDEAMAVMGLVN